MSVPSNITNPDPTIPVPQGIYEESTTQLTPLGTEIKVGDRTFRYAGAGAALAVGDCLASPDSNLSSKQTAGAAAAVGDRTITAYIVTSVAAQHFADGYLLTADSGNQGYLYKVKSHPAIGNTAVGTITLYDGLALAITTADKLSLIPSKYKSVGLCGATSAVAGFAPVAVTSGNYFWAQVKGPSAARVLSAAAYGALLVPGATGGLTAIDATANDSPVAQVLSNAGTTADHVIVSVNLP